MRLDGTPLIDLKPDRCLFTPFAPPPPGDFEANAMRRLAHLHPLGRDSSNRRAKIDLRPCRAAQLAGPHERESEQLQACPHFWRSRIVIDCP